MSNDLIDRQAAMDALDCINGVEEVLRQLPSAQPELIERTAYIRGFEQGRTQGMIDSQGGKNMIKAEWTNADTLDLQPTCNRLATDCISRQAAIDGVKTLHDVAWKNWHEPTLSANAVLDMIRELPSAQPRCNFPEKTQLSEEDTTSDCISRQELLRRTIYNPQHASYITEQDVKGMPSAQPEIIRCSECKHRRDQSKTTAWLPCRALIVPDDFSCIRAERREE